MDIPSIYNNGIVNPDGSLKVREHKSALGQEDFLKLLVTKMTAQDPMNPQADTDFIAQMAQFSSLEQTKSMSSEIATLRSQQEMLTANGLIGRSVTLNDGEKIIGQGMVSSVSVKEGDLAVQVNGKDYALDQVGLISPLSLIA
jgi:flagellar basal-body rod modification protein FlgD